MITENSVGAPADTDRLGQQICELAGHQAAAMCRWLLLIADFDAREGWAVDGIISCAHWLSWRCAIALGTARDHVTVSRGLRNLPLTVARFATGELSYAKVRALVRIATPETERQLIELALEATASQFEQMVREFKASEREALGKAAKRRARRYLRYRYDQDGSMIITVRVEPEEGALVIDYVEALARTEAPADTWPAEPAGSSAEEPAAAPTPDPEPDPEPEPDENTIETSPGEQARADALVALARRAAITLGDDAPVVGDRPHLLIHLSIDALGRPGGGHLDHGPALAYETACRLGCEATMAVIVEGRDGNPLHLGATTRGINRAQRQALLARDKGCRFPGCTNRRYLHAHHIVHWIDGGPTCIANLVLLCSRHHHLVHEGGYGCTAANGTVSFTRPGGRVPITDAPTAPPVDHRHGVVAQNGQLGLTITADTPRSLSEGERYDRVLTSDVLWGLLHPKAFFGDAYREPAGVAA